MARCAVRAAFSGAIGAGDSRVIEHLFSPLNAGWDGAAHHPYQMVPRVPIDQGLAGAGRSKVAALATHQRAITDQPIELSSSDCAVSSREAACFWSLAAFSRLS
jgi:hypothetical protein